MSSTALFVQSLVIGFSIAAPVGPIGLLVIQRSLRDGPAVGLSIGLGAATADAVYGGMGAYGVHGLIRWLNDARMPLAIGGAALLLWLAWRTWQASRGRNALLSTEASLLRPMLGLPAAFSGSFVLTLSNPATIVSFIAIFGSLAAQQQGAVASPALMVIGVWLGSALWWLFLCALVSRVRANVDARGQRRIAASSAAVLAAFAFWTLWTLWPR